MLKGLAIPFSSEALPGWVNSTEAAEQVVVKNPPANAGDIRDAGSVPGSGRSPGGRHGNPLQYSFLENSMDRGAMESQRVGHG